MNKLLKYSVALIGFAVTTASGGSLSISNSKGFSSNPIVDRAGVVLKNSDPVIVAIGTFASAPSTAIPGAGTTLSSSAYSGLLAEFTPYGACLLYTSDAADE